MNTLSYMVGPLLYIPSLNEKAADKIINHKFDCLTSCCFCLEDTIIDSALETAENTLYNTLKKISIMPSNERPLIFVRIRTPEHLLHIYKKFNDVQNIITGYILPKFDLSNAEDYAYIIKDINSNSTKKITYFMPILESRMIADVCTRVGTLQKLKEIIDTINEYILNIRIGGNDFCNIYGLRRNINQTIYDINVIKDIITDIINVFSFDYIISGPVWEYFKRSDEDNNWSIGLQREVELDKLNGIIGKTCIHPSQVPIIYNSLKVTKEDYDDACKILDWKSNNLAVSKSISSRMNEVKCHIKWATKIKTLGNIYGIQ